MAQTQEGVYRRQDSRFWWIATTLPNGKRIRQSAGTENRQDAEALLAKIRLEAFREHHFGFKPQRSWQEAVAPEHLHNVMGKDRVHLFEKVEQFFMENLKVESRVRP